MTKFKDFLLNENKAFLGAKIGDILNALQDLSDNYQNMGSRYVSRNAEEIVNQIRRIIHTKWPDREINNLKSLRDCGVALMKGINEKNDLEIVIKSCITTLAQSLKNIQTPINQFTKPG